MSTILKQTQQTIHNWWLFVLIGIVMIIGGIYIFQEPVDSYITLSLFFSIMIIVNGISDIFFSITNRTFLKGWGWYLFGGIVKTFMGIVLFNHPNLTMNILPLILGFWLLFGAVSIMSGSLDLKSYKIKGWGWIMAAGILLMLFSMEILLNPSFGAGTIVVLTSMAIITYGIGYIILGFYLKKVKDLGHDIKKSVGATIDDLKAEVLNAIKNATDDKDPSDEIEQKFDDYSKNQN